MLPMINIKKNLNYFTETEIFSEKCFFLNLKQTIYLQ